MVESARSGAEVLSAKAYRCVASQRRFDEAALALNYSNAAASPAIVIDPPALIPFTHPHLAQGKA